MEKIRVRNGENNTTVIFGAGETARQVAETAAALGAQTILITEDRIDAGAGAETIRSAAAVSLLTETRLKGVRGTIGDFTVTLERNGETGAVQAARLVLAEPETRKASFSDHGLAPSDAVISLSDVNARLTDPAAFGWPEEAPGHLVFLHGIATESSPAVAEEVMTAAMRLQTAFGVQTYVLVGNLKVAADGLEALYRQTKEAGVFYVKFTDTAPAVTQAADGTVFIEFADEVTRQRFSLRPDMTVVDEAVAPAAATARIARLLGLETDAAGFAQADNVHRWAVSTNRRGIFAAGPARAVQTRQEHRLDAVCAAAQTTLATANGKALEDRARIDQRRCIRCLTCFRLCPYGAVRITEAERVEVTADACERCGICAAECPRTAIAIPGLGRDELFKSTPAAPNAGAQIVAFCCTRSAAQAGRYARRLGLTTPSGLKMIEVPCAGTVSLGHLMAAFGGGADGVMVLSCHPDNCHSRCGNELARQRADLLAVRLGQIGIAPGRIAVRTLASNMGVEFAEAVNDFENSLSSLGRVE